MCPAEALLMGKPAVAYDIPTHREAYEEVLNDGVFLVPVSNEQAMAETVKKLLSEPHRRRPRPAWLDIDVFNQRLLEIVPPLRVTVGMIAFNADDYIKQALDSVYDRADQIIIVEGAVMQGGVMDKYANPDGSSTAL